jgi:hypothetical protein
MQVVIKKAVIQAWLTRFMIGGPLAICGRQASTEALPDEQTTGVSSPATGSSKSADNGADAGTPANDTAEADAAKAAK